MFGNEMSSFGCLPSVAFFSKSSAKNKKTTAKIDDSVDIWGWGYQSLSVLSNNCENGNNAVFSKMNQHSGF